MVWLKTENKTIKHRAWKWEVMEFSSCSLQAETWRDAIWLMIWNSLINLNPRNRQSRGAASQGGKEDAGRLGCELHDIRGGNTPKVSKSSGTPFCRRPGWGAHKGDSPAPLCLWHQLGNLSTRNLFWEAIAEVPRIKKKKYIIWSTDWNCILAGIECWRTVSLMDYER